jgi:hypothetical protein
LGEGEPDPYTGSGTSRSATWKGES